MAKKWLILGGMAILAPLSFNKWFNSLCPELPKGIVINEPAQALPSFARQTGFSCSTCHTIPPQLNPYGRIFKIRGYTDGTAIGEILLDDNKKLLQYNPISLRVLNYPYSKVKGQDRKSLIPEEFIIAFGGRVSENVGAYVAGAQEAGENFGIEIMKLNFVWDVGGNILGATLFKSSPGLNDPFSSFNYYTSNRFTRYRGSLFDNARRKFTSDLWLPDSRGAGVYAYIGDLVYASVGAYTGTMQDGDGNPINKGESDPFDVFARVAITPPLPVNVNFGAFYYSGKDKLDTTNIPTGDTQAKPTRYGIDGGIYHSFGDFGAQLFATYMDAKDKYDVSPVFKHKGYNIQGNLFWKNKVGVALNYGFYDYKTDNPLRPGGQAGRQIKDTTLHVSYMFRPNVRIAGEYTSTSQKGGSSSYTQTLIVDFAF